MTTQDDREDRQLALKLATQVATKFHKGDITLLAERLYKFLQTGEAQPAPEDPKGATATRGDVKDFSKLPAGLSFRDGPTPEEKLKNSVSRLSDSGKEVLNAALTEALQMGRNVVTPEFLLLGILRQGQSKAHAALIDLAGDGKAVRKAVIGKLTS